MRNESRNDGRQRAAGQARACILGDNCAKYLPAHGMRRITAYAKAENGLCRGDYVRIPARQWLPDSNARNPLKTNNRCTAWPTMKRRGLRTPKIQFAARERSI